MVILGNHNRMVVTMLPFKVIGFNYSLCHFVIATHPICVKHVGFDFRIYAYTI